MKKCTIGLLVEPFSILNRSYGVLRDEFVKEENVACDETDLITDIIDDMEDQDKEEDEDGPAQILTRQAIKESTQKPAEKRDLESIICILREILKTLMSIKLWSMDSAQPLKDNLDFNIIEDSDKQTEQEGITDASKSIETEDNLNKTKDKE